MSRSLSASDRSSLIRLASTLPAGSPERKAILAGLSKVSLSTGMMIRLLEPTTLLYYNDALGPAFRPEHKKYNIKANAGDLLYFLYPFSVVGAKGFLVVPSSKLTLSGKPKGNNFARYFIPEGTRFEEV